MRADFTPPPTSDFEVAVFVATNRNNLFSSPPRVPGAGETAVTVNGLANGVLHFVGLGIRPTSGGAYQQAGPSLTVTPGNPLFVDAASTAGSPDGLTPATAFPDLFTAVLTAFAAVSLNPTVSVNVWVKGGSYPITSTLPVTAGVNIYGGFGAAFDLASRDVTNSASVWTVAAGQVGLAYGDQLDTNLAVVLDGVRFDGNDVGSIAIDTDGTDPCQLEMRSVIVTDMTDRGLRLRNVTTNSFDVVLTNCQSSRNGADGLNGNGAFDYSIFNSVFASNFQEGIDLNDLSVETAGIARLNLTSSQMFGNGAEGLDCTLGAPLFPTDGTFDISVRGCSFERNALAGCLIDCDFELVNGYSAQVELRESIARGNGSHGFLLDLDGPLDPNESLSASIYRVRSTSNGQNGIYVTSESRAGVLAISTSALVGNVGAGLRAEGPIAGVGNRAVLVSHSLFASNFGGGMISRDLPASAVSCIAYQQPSPFDASTVQVGNVITDDPAMLAFVSAPEEYARVTARSGAVLTLAAPPSFPLGASLELADDGTSRMANSINGSQVTLSEAPTDFGLPGLLAAFAPGSADVNEDYALLAGSIALGAGLNASDAGPAGSAAPGTPGLTDEEPIELLFPLGTTPEVAEVVGANESIVIRFSKTLNAASVTGTSVRAARAANTLNASLQTAGATLTLIAPGGGWGAGDFRVELDGVRASDGTELSGALVIPFQR